MLKKNSFKFPLNLSKPLKVNRLEFHFIESLHNIANQKHLNFCAYSARRLRKIDHVLLWILTNDTRLLQCSLCAEQRTFQWLAMFCLYTLPLARPDQAEIQMLTAICSIGKLIPRKEVNLSHLYYLCWRRVGGSEKSPKKCWRNIGMVLNQETFLIITPSLLCL